MKKLAFFFSCVAISLLFLYSVRFSLGEIRTNVLDLMLFLNIIFLCILFFRENRKKVFPKALFLGITMVFFGVFLSAFFQEITSRELGILKSWFVLPLIFAFLFGYIFPREKDNTLLLYAYVWGAVFVGFVSIMLFLEGSGMTYDGRLSGWYSSPNELALYITPALIFLWVRIRVKKVCEDKKTVFFKEVLPFVILGVDLLLTQSYGGILSFLGGIVFLEGFLLKKRWKNIFFGIVIGCGVIVGVFGLLGQEKLESLLVLDDRSSIASRFMIWRSAWDIGRDHWFLGIGPGNFQEYYLEYQQYYPPYLEWAVPQPHNIFLAFWLQGGIFGLLGFLVVVGMSLYRLWEKLHKQKKRDMLTLFLFSFFSMTLIWGLVDTPYWRNDLSILFWMMVFLSLMQKDYGRRFSSIQEKWT
jgi:O-antigen ligase